ncbi:glycosyltransferase family 4 protein [Alphaproteobacteria bacterium]|nr:glycosyltransferase family 4 protein [Alphaproteobacteria bacterium]
MKINILLPFKEKFDENKASSVSITVRNNLLYSNYLNQIKVFGQNVENPLFKNNFVGLKYSISSLKSRNKFLAHEMLKLINKDPDKKQLIEIHNRPYLVKQITKGNGFPVSLFFHNDPQTMKGSKSIREREDILEKCAAIFCVSEFIKKKFLEGINDNLQKVHVLYNGVDRKLKKFPKKKKEVLFVGRLVPEKGVDLYVDVIGDIANKFLDWQFDLIGSFRLGDDKNEGSFANNIIRKFKKNSKQTRFYGFKNQDFVQGKMKRASIIVIPSIWEEPYGLVAAEAMSNGIAIIASDVGGIPEVLKENGILIKNINKFKLKNELERLMNNTDKIKILQKLSWDNFEHSSKNSSKNLDNYRKRILYRHFVNY